MDDAFRSENFGFLVEYDAQLVRLGALAERYFSGDPNTCLLKLRQFGELLAQQVAARTGVFAGGGDRRLSDRPRATPAHRDSA